MNFKVQGKYFEKGVERKFTKKVEAFNDSTAREKTLALIGSNHKVRRKDIMIEETILLEEAKNEQ